jgi:hypothetical protein
LVFYITLPSKSQLEYAVYASTSLTYLLHGTESLRNASTSTVSNSAPFWDITQRIVVTPWRRFGTTYRFQLQGPTLEDGTNRLFRNAGK